MIIFKKVNNNETHAFTAFKRRPSVAHYFRFA